MVCPILTSLSDTPGPMSLLAPGGAHQGRLTRIAAAYIARAMLISRLLSPVTSLEKTRAAAVAGSERCQDSFLGGQGRRPQLPTQPLAGARSAKQSCPAVIRVHATLDQ